MESAIKVVDQVYWVGMNDRESPLFESIWPVANGVSYNSYLILDQKIALLDTVKKISTPNYLRQLKRLVPTGKLIDYLVVHHLAPDHSGAIPMLLDLFPKLQIFGTRKAAEFLKNLYNSDQNFTVVTDGDELGLGERRLKFVTTPMVHRPETMMSYEQKTKIMFSGDAFGGFGSLDGGIFDDTVDIEYYESEILRYFSNIVGKFAPMVQKAIAKLKGLDIRIVASTHGPVWRSRPNRIIELYDRWSRHQPEQGVVVDYGSMYGNSEKMMESIVRGLVQEGLRTVRVHNVSKSHNSFIISDIWRYRGLILGSPTYDARLLPQAESLVSLLADTMLRNRCVGVFGSCGWSGGAVKSLREFVTRSGLELVESVIEARFAPNQEQLKKCIELGRRVGSKVLRGTVN